MGFTWAYGVTTCIERLETLLPRTLKSLAAGGFDKPRLFVDGATSMDSVEYSNRFNCHVTGHCPRLRIFGNWLLGIYELYIRNPEVDRYAIFQDDLVTCKNLRGYLDQVPYLDKSYWNLYTFPQNQELANGRQGFYPSNQYGKGALALVFDRNTLIQLLSSRRLVERPTDTERGWRNIDGGIVTSLSNAGWMEMVHNPSLVQHTGKGPGVSTIGIHDHPLAPSFPGEDFDALTLLEQPL
jgi:hypothetical protein